ncbi:cytochrome b6-f complex iron-sulfur subunit [Peptococcaceae bacterium CEB3]|nr:cytochrome b6-f complex iron-sulfur subunit [Peptococcaceae bacterium CEB3]
MDKGSDKDTDKRAVPVTRRRFLGLGVGSVAGVVALGYVGLAFDFLNPPPAGAEPLREVGQTGDFNVNEPRLVTYKGNGIEQGVYVINLGAEGWLALDFHCTHLQCAVNWVGSVNKFMCPCHGGVYDIRGHVLSGPPPRPLYHRVIKIQGNSVMVGGRQA